jgi:hypothetical protein
MTTLAGTRTRWSTSYRVGSRAPRILHDLGQTLEGKLRRPDSNTNAVDETQRYVIGYSEDGALASKAELFVGHFHLRQFNEVREHDPVGILAPAAVPRRPGVRGR